MSDIFFLFFRRSIRANQHTETLQAQYTVLQQQKDDLLAKLSIADDREAKNQAALTNLQCALEQFQKGKLIGVTQIAFLNTKSSSFPFR